MRDLLPESWRTDDATSSCCRTPRPKRGGLVTDISLWTECYSLLVAVLLTKHPDKGGHFMAYLRTIVRASRNYEDSAWASYDAAYRRQAANSRSLDWGIVDSALFSEAFTGRAKQIPRCQYCLAETHRSNECQYGPGTDELRPSKFPRYSPRGGLSTGHFQYTNSQHNGIELCGRFNQAGGNRCTFQRCRYAHICAKCRRGPHPASECLSLGNGSGAGGGRLPLLNSPSPRQ